MSPVRVTMKRTLGQLCSTYTAAIATAGFLAVSGALFAFRLAGAEGSPVSPVTVWASSVSLVLPFLAAFLAMDTWSRERATRVIDILLTTAVRERDLVIGKFIAVLLVLAFAVGLSLVGTLVASSFVAPRLVPGFAYGALLTATFGLIVQGALWCAVSTAVSAIFKSPALAAVTSVVVTTLLPRSVYFALLAWTPLDRTTLGEMIFDAHAIDFAAGVISVPALAGYAVLIILSLFANTKFVAACRFVGRGARSIRFSTAFTLLLAFLLAGATVALAARVNYVIDIPVTGEATRGFSAFTRGVLAEARGRVTITAFLSRRDPRFRSVAQFLRALAREAETVGGVTLALRYVDPSWDLGEAERLVKGGVKPDSIVFERSRRMTFVALADGWSERAAACAITRVALPPMRRNVYWTRGHGEGDPLDYGPFGMSDIARELAAEGYRNLTLDLSDQGGVPADCALVVVSGPRTVFSRAELDRLDKYLRQGGRLLALLETPGESGLGATLSAWGIRVAPGNFADARTLNGNDVIITDFSDHPIASPIKGAQIVLDRPVAFSASAAAETGTGADRIEYSALAMNGAGCVAAVAERGAGTGGDLSIRPTRIVAVGDASFVMNGELESLANANRDFFLNAVAFLSGTTVIGDTSTEVFRLDSGLDRNGRARFIVVLALLAPLAVFLPFTLITAIKRRRR